MAEKPEFGRSLTALDADQPSADGLDLGRNNLLGQSSPHLSKHVGNPVHWQPWSQEALAAAREARKPILLSIGFAACHWCAVMAREAFADAETAKSINDAFVPILVDRDERPDIDYLYQYAAGILGQRGGWPLNLIMAPDGHPFWAGTYFPAEPSIGLPAFRDVLRSVSKAFGQDETCVRNFEVLTPGPERLASPGGTARLGQQVVDNARASLLELVDWRHGGIGSAPKFPEVPALGLLWQGWRHGAEKMRDAVLLTLNRICQGGIYDHLGGGFARYSIDDRWLVPHFEKLISDNALLIELLTEVWLDENSPLYAQRVAETVGWLEREMLLPNGGFAQSLSAEAGGEDGSFYVWEPHEIKGVLGRRAQGFNEAYGIIQTGNWRGKSVPNRLHCSDLGFPPDDAALEGDRRRLLTARNTREPPERDDRILADASGMLISALAGAGKAFDRSDWIELARSAFSHVSRTMSLGDGRLAHFWHDGTCAEAGYLDDYAQMARAALALHTVTGSSEYLDWAMRWVDHAQYRFWDMQGGGYFMSSDDGERLISPIKCARDAFIPSGNAAMIHVLAQLHDLTGEAAYQDMAHATASCFLSEIPKGAYGMESLLSAVEVLAARA